MTRPNVLLIVLDTARFDIVNESDLMPTLQTIGKEGCQFTNSFANAPWTLPSHSSIFTGRLPSDHGVTDGGQVFDADRDLVSMLAQDGYTTAAFSNNPWISPDFGFNTFDDFVACWKRFQRGSDLAGISQLEGTGQQLKAIAGNLLNRDAPFTLANAFYMRFLRGRYDSGARLTNRLIKQWLDERDSHTPFFAFINYMEPHLAYDPPTEYVKQYLPAGIDIETAEAINQDPWAHLVGEESMGETEFEILRALYRAELTYLDDRLEELYDYLNKTDLLNETAIFLIGDHGENIGDHGLMDHQYALYDTLIHVPLTVRHPSHFNANTRFEGLVELRDIFPTILDLADIEMETDDPVAATSLTEFIGRGEGREYAISEYPCPQPAIETLRQRYDRIQTDLEPYDRSLRSIRTTDWKYIEGSDGRHELYRINEDPNEVRNVAGSTPEIERELEAALENRLGKMKDSGVTRNGREIPEANKQHLEDLGYL